MKNTIVLEAGEDIEPHGLVRVGKDGKAYNTSLNPIGIAVSRNRIIKTITGRLSLVDPWFASIKIGDLDIIEWIENSLPRFDKMDHPTKRAYKITIEEVE